MGISRLLLVTPVFKAIFEPLGIRVEQFNALSACVVVGVMIIPLVSSLSEDVLSAVPQGLREAAYGLGATKFEVSTRVVLPAGLSGVVASFILAISRAVGETMAVVLAAGMLPQITLNPLTSLETMTTYIVQVIGGEAAVRISQVPVALRRGAGALRDHAVPEHRVEPGAAPLSRGLPMSDASAPRFRPHRLIRSLLGPLFGTICFLATLTGVVVLFVLLGSILFAALQGKPDNPWYAIGANASELFSLAEEARHAASVKRSSRSPGFALASWAVSGCWHWSPCWAYPWASAPGSTSRSTLRRAGCGESFRPTSPTWRAFPRLFTASLAWPSSCVPSASRACRLGPRCWPVS